MSRKARNCDEPRRTPVRSTSTATGEGRLQLLLLPDSSDDSHPLLPAAGGARGGYGVHFSRSQSQNKESAMTVPGRERATVTSGSDSNIVANQPNAAALCHAHLLSHTSSQSDDAENRATGGGTWQMSIALNDRLTPTTIINCVLFYRTETILATFALLFPPLGVIAFIVLVSAYSRRLTNPVMSSNLERLSVAMSTVGLLASIVTLIVTVASISSSNTKLRHTVPDLSKYPFRVAAHWNDCVYGYYFLGNCYYDAKYQADDRWEPSMCDGDNGADWNLGRCFYSTPAVCRYANNFINGTCHKYGFQCDIRYADRPFSRSACHQCPGGLIQSGVCYYTYRREPSTFFGIFKYCKTCGSLVDGYCYYYNRTSSASRDKVSVGLNMSGY